MESLELLRVAVIEDEVGVQGGSLGEHVLHVKRKPTRSNVMTPVHRGPAEGRISEKVIQLNMAQKLPPYSHFAALALLKP